MKWSFEWGKHEERLTRLADKGQSIPALDRKPDIVGLEWIWEAFWKLSTCRQVGMGVGAIPWVAIDRYAIREGLTWEESQHFEFCIMSMDREFLEHQDKQTEKKHANHRT